MESVRHHENLKDVSNHVIPNSSYSDPFGIKLSKLLSKGSNFSNKLSPFARTNRSLLKDMIDE